MLKNNPPLYARSCKVCLQFMFDEKTGKKVMRRGAPMPRSPGSVPCVVGKCDRGHPDAPNVLTRANLQAYEHYLECKATGTFPDDPIVRRNAAMIRMAEEHVERLHQSQLENAALIPLLNGGGR